MIHTLYVSDETTKLGFVGDNEAVRIAFPIADFLAQYGSNGTWYVLNTRPDEDEAYPVPAQYLSADDKFLYWTLTNYDVQNPGVGCVFLQYRDGALVKGKKKYRTSIVSSPADSGITPSPYRTWLDELAQIKGEAEEARDTAREYAERAEEAGVHQPIIQNGTWWVWDIESEQYIDTFVRATGASDWSEITGKPTTLDGYGITDAYHKNEVYNKTETYDKEEVDDEIQNVREVAEGKTATYVISVIGGGLSDVDNELFATQDNSVTFTKIKTNSGEIISAENLKKGDNIYILQLNYPDRWVSSVSRTHDPITGEYSYSANAAKLETTKVDLTNYYQKSETYNRTEIDGKVDKKSTIFFAEVGTTTHASILAAYNRGDTIFARSHQTASGQNQFRYMPLVQYDGATGRFVFAAVHSNKLNGAVPTAKTDFQLRYAVCNSTGWASSVPINAYIESPDLKVTSLSAASTNLQYPSAKCVYDFVNSKAKTIYRHNIRIEFDDGASVGDFVVSILSTDNQPINSYEKLRTAIGERTENCSGHGFDGGGTMWMAQSITLAYDDIELHIIGTDGSQVVTMNINYVEATYTDTITTL